MTTEHQGKRWTQEQDDSLTKWFRRTKPDDLYEMIKGACYVYGRSQGSIESRLSKLRLLDRSYYVQRYKLSR